jgi:hypothetical protein
MEEQPIDARAFTAARLYASAFSPLSHKLIPTASVPPRADECEFVPEALLFAKERNDLLLNPVGELINAIGLEMHGHFSGKRPTALYYYRELQNLRDPLHFRASRR